MLCRQPLLISGDRNGLLWMPSAVDMNGTPTSGRFSVSDLAPRSWRQPNDSAPLNHRTVDGHRAFRRVWSRRPEKQQKKNAEIARLSVRIKQMEEEGSRKQDTLTTIIREMRDQLERPGNTLELPDGHVTHVDYERQEVLINITRRQGARPQMKMSIFDSASPGIPNEKPKGMIELTQVGEQFSTARIIKTNNPIEPIRVGDIVYSPAWSPNIPTRFALVGKMDVNRDDKDDRDELKRMIQEAGGLIDFDLPPPDVGKETGTLSPRIDWYVIDDRTRRQGRIEQRMGEVIKEARLNGIRPMPIGRLLAFLGYGMSQPVAGRAEAVHTGGTRQATGPRQQVEPAAKPAASAPPETKSDELKGDETNDQGKRKTKKSP